MGIKGINKDGKVVEINGDEWEKAQEAKNTEQVNRRSPQFKDKRSRKFCLSSYIDVRALEPYISTQSWVQHWAMCTHDRDLKEDGSIKETHTHILLYTYEAKTASAIKKIFDRLSNQVYLGTDTPPQNTNVQVMYDSASQWRYLIHKDDNEKVQYDEKERICDNFAYWHNLEKKQGLTDSTENSGLQVVTDILEGATTMELIERYGKDYIYHAKAYKECIRDINYEEHIKTHQGIDFVEFFPFLINESPFTIEEKRSFERMLRWIQSECYFTYNSVIDVYLNNDTKRLKQKGEI